MDYLAGFSNTPPTAIGADLLTSLYAPAGEAALVGSFVAGTSDDRAEILTRMRYEPLPADLLEAALEVRDDEVLWALSHRTDLTPKAIRTLIKHGGVLVCRMLATNPLMSDEDLKKILSTDEIVRLRVFLHPSAKEATRLQCLTLRDRNNSPVPLQQAFTDEISKPEYALWLLKHGMQVGQVNPLTHLRSLSATHQWDLAQHVAEGHITLSAASESAHWLPPLETALWKARDVEARSGVAAGRSELGRLLRVMKRPPLSAQDEVRLLPDPTAAETITTASTLDWGALEKSVRDGRVTLPAVRCLMNRNDRPQSFTSAAIVHHGEELGVLSECSLTDLQGAVAMSGFAPVDRARLTSLLVRATDLPYDLLQLLGNLPVNDVLMHLQKMDDALRRRQTSRLSRELSAVLGDDFSAWFRFEEARHTSAKITLNAAVARAVEAA